MSDALTTDERAVLRALYGARGLAGLSVGELLDHRGTLAGWTPARVRDTLRSLQRIDLVTMYRAKGASIYRINKTGVAVMRETDPPCSDFCDVTAAGERYCGNLCARTGRHHAHRCATHERR